MALSAKRLKRILSHRERLERLQEARLADAGRRRQERVLALEGTRSRREDILAAGVPLRGPVDAQALNANMYAMLGVEREILARSAALAHSDREVAGERETLLGRSRDRKAIETLLDHRLQAERRARLRADALRLDEQASVRWLLARDTERTAS
jgi:flagellar export protein FliJ